MLRRMAGPRVLVLSELLPAAGDLLAAVEADYVLRMRTIVVIVGDRTALALALRTRGVRVVGRRGAAKHVDAVLRSASEPENASERLNSVGRARAAASVRQIQTSRRRIERGRWLCAQVPGGGAQPGVQR